MDSDNNHLQIDAAAPVIGVVVVIYNKRCSESVSFTKILSFCVPAVFLIDNSTDSKTAAYNRQYCLDLNQKRTGSGDVSCNGNSGENAGRAESQITPSRYAYFSMDGNAGLAKAYNTAIRLAGNRVDYMLILDDDTGVPDDLFSHLRAGIVSNPDADILVPYVTDQKSLLSPNRRVNCLFFRMRRRPDVFTSRMSAINSGLVIKLRPGAEPYFDEAQFLDCIDHLFIFRQIAGGARIRLYQAQFRQMFFDQAPDGMEGQEGKTGPAGKTGQEGKTGDDGQEEAIDTDGQKTREARTLIRFHYFVKDFRYFCKACSLHMWIAEPYLLYRAVKLSIRYRTPRFFASLKRV